MDREAKEVFGMRLERQAETTVNEAMSVLRIAGDMERRIFGDIPAKPNDRPEFCSEGNGVLHRVHDMNRHTLQALIDTECILNRIAAEFVPHEMPATACAPTSRIGR